MYYVYILQSNIDNSLYTGYTANLKRRFSEHNQGLNISTKKLMPWKLIYYEAYNNQMDAKKREIFLKSGGGKKYLDKQLTEYFYHNPRKKFTR